jgi:hypothetical protein
VELLHQVLLDSKETKAQKKSWLSKEDALRLVSDNK